jgi:DNA-binding FrmR family transcriptional regulator
VQHRAGVAPLGRAGTKSKQDQYSQKKSQTQFPMDCKKLINHLNRITGQINTLKKYLELEQNCDEVINLTTAIDKSFDTLKANIAKGYILKDIIEPANSSNKKKLHQIETLIKLIKK